MKIERESAGKLPSEGWYTDVWIKIKLNNRKTKQFYQHNMFKKKC